MVELTESEVRLEEYLQQTRPSESWPRRTVCCDSSRSFYCCECCKICIPEESLPTPIFEGYLRFPFDIDIILDAKERKTSATGIQLFALAKALQSRREKLNLPKAEKSVVLHDLGKTDVPDYRSEENVYVLFPSKNSVPISSVSPAKLVVLDIKWSSLGVNYHDNIACLPKVHLDSPPPQSYFWRWHNAGKGMLSTIEATYCATLEVTRESWPSHERDDLVHMLWLFALQRSVIHVRSEMEKRLLPFTEEGKESRRILRVRQKGNPSKKRVEPDTLSSTS